MGNTVEDKMVKDKMGKESFELSLLQRVKTGGGNPPFLILSSL